MFPHSLFDGKHCLGFCLFSWACSSLAEQTRLIRFICNSFLGGWLAESPLETSRVVRQMGFHSTHPRSVWQSTVRVWGHLSLAPSAGMAPCAYNGVPIEHGTFACNHTTGKKVQCAQDGPLRCHFVCPSLSAPPIRLKAGKFQRWALGKRKGGCPRWLQVVCPKCK